MGDFQIFLFDYLDLKIMGQSIYIISVLKKPIKKLFLVEKELLCPSFLLSFTVSPSFSPSLSSFLPSFPLLPVFNQGWGLGHSTENVEP